MNRKILSLFIAFTVFIQIPALAIEEQNTKVYLYKNFSKDVVGKQPRSLSTVAAKDNSITVEDDNGTNYVKMSVKSTTDMYVEQSGSFEGKVIFETKMKFENFKNSTKLLFLMRDSSLKDARLLTVDSDGWLLNYGKERVIQLVTGKLYHIALAVDFDLSRYDIYIDGKEQKTDCLMNDLKNSSLIRFQIFQIYSPCNTIIDIYEIFAYEGTKILSGETREKVIEEELAKENGPITADMIYQKTKNLIVMYAGAKKAIVAGRTKMIDEQSKTVTPVFKGMIPMIPLRFVMEELGGSVYWNPETNETAIILGSKNASVQLGSDLVKIQGIPQKLPETVFTVDNRTMVPASLIELLSGKKVITDKTGLIAFGDSSTVFDWRTERKLISAIIGEMVYERPSGEEVIATLKEKNPGNAHPRVFATQSTFDFIKENLESDKYIKKWHGEVIKAADSLLSQPVQTYVLSDGIRLLNVSKEVLRRMRILGYAYKVTNDVKYAERGWHELESAGTFKDWNPRHTLDTAEMLAAFGVGYDWLYDYFNESQKEYIRNAIITKGFSPLRDDYLDNPRERTFYWSTAAQPNNWNTICNSGAIVAAVAIGDEAEEESAFILKNAINSIEQSLNLFAPDGAWFEGLGYWQYTVEYMTNGLSTLNAALGTDYGCFIAPGIKDTGYFLFNMQGAGGAFNYYDMGEYYIQSPEIFWIANMLGDQDLVKLRLNAMDTRSIAGCVNDLIWYKGNPEDRDVELPDDNYYRISEAVTMRSGWDDGSSIFVGFKAGKNDVPHSHLDCGSFVLDSKGARFAMDLGKDDYNLAGGTYNRYRYRAEGHNTLVINPSDGYDQKFTASTLIDRYEFAPGSSYAITDMSDAYSENAESVVRGIMLLKNEDTVVIQDEVKASENMDLWWFMHTRATVQIIDNGKAALLTNSGQHLVARILNDVDGVFTVMDAAPLPTSPVIEGQNPNLGVQKLAINIKDKKNVVVSIGFKPTVRFDVIPAIEEYPAVIPLSEWKSNHEVEQKELPKLNSLEIDGEVLDVFNPNIRAYTVNLEPGEYRMPVIEAEGEGKVEVIYPEQLSGTARIILEKDGIWNSYTVTINLTPLIGKPVGLKEIKVVNVTASAVPQPENGIKNTLDNDFGTRWSAQGICWIKYDFGEIKEIEQLGMAFFRGDERNTIFEIFISDDDQNWKKVFAGSSGGKTNDVELYNLGNLKGRYIRINGYGSTQGDWTSITEFIAYERKENASFEGREASMIIALYDGNDRLVQLNTVQGVVAPGSVFTSTVQVPENAEDYHVKTFLMDASDLVSPLKKADILN